MSSFIRHRSRATFAAGTLDIGFVVSDDSSPVTADSDIKTELENRGHSVTYINDNDATGSETHDVILISASISGATVGDTYKNSTNGIVIYEHSIYDDMDMASTFGTDTGETTIDVEDSAHPIAVEAGVSGDGVTIYTSNGSIRYATSGNLGSGAEIIIASPGNADRGAIFVYESGAALNGFGSASGRRAGFWVIEGDVDILNTTGLDLLEATLKWAGGLI